MYRAKRREKRWRNPTHERRPARSGSATNAMHLDAVTRQDSQDGRFFALPMSGQHAAVRHPPFPPPFPRYPPHSRRQPTQRPSSRRARSRPRSSPAFPATRPTQFPTLRRSSASRPARSVRAAPEVLRYDRCAQRPGVHRGSGPNSCLWPHPAHDVSVTRVQSGELPRGRAAAARRRYAVLAADARRSAADNVRLGVALRSASRVPEHRARFYSKS
jgi:hypothetical protein